MRFVLIALLLAGCARPPAETSDWERQNIKSDVPREEGSLALPAYPEAAKLVEFQISDPRGFRFFVDSGSLSVADGIVRYVLVAQSPDGARNVSFEGLRCGTSEHRVYAFGHRDGTWSPSRTAWQALGGARPWQIALYREYFCPQKQTIHDAGEGLRALQAGGHPFYKGTSPQMGR